MSLSPTVAAYGYWNAQFFHASPGYVRFQLEVPRGASFGVYARRNALPTHTTYDLMEVVKGVAAADGDGGDSGRARRASKVGRDIIQGCQMAKFDPFLSLDCARVEGVGAQSKERKGSNFAA